MAVSSSRTLRIFYLVLGIFFVGIAFIGIPIPLIPTVGPVLLAGFFFSKSSERFDRWLVENRFFGGIIRDWRAGRGFTLRAKMVAIAAIAVTFTISVVFVIDMVVIRIGLIAFAAALAVYIWQLPTKQPVPETA
ncbi:MAG: YbaN family protein [Actinomycetota bacterium]